jgi:membrane protease YdiL (CAAX protease family)
VAVAMVEEPSDDAQPSPSLLPSSLRPPLVQATLCLAGYLFHVAFLSRRHVRLGAFNLGLDTLVGLGVLAGVANHRQRTGARPVPAWIFGEVDPDDSSDAGRECLDLRTASKSDKSKVATTAAITLLAPFFFSQVSPFFDVLLLGLAAAGLPLTRSSLLAARLCLEQATVYFCLLKLMSIRHRDADAPFFGKSSRWVRWGWRRPWLLPALGGYAASLGIFNLVEPLNQALLPFLELMPEGMVAKLANPADGKLGSLFLGALTPCVGAPLFEEIHSRAFLMQALTTALPLRLALPVGGFIFGAQHFQIGLVLPLAAMGYFWGVLYAFSGNLLVPIIVHALWNSRIFIGSILAL